MDSKRRERKVEVKASDVWRTDNDGEDPEPIEPMKPAEIRDIQCIVPIDEKTIVQIETFERVWAQMFPDKNDLSYKVEFGTSFALCMNELLCHMHKFLKGEIVVNPRGPVTICQDAKFLQSLADRLDEWTCLNVVTCNRPSLAISLLTLTVIVRYHIQACLWLIQRSTKWLPQCLSHLPSLSTELSDFQQDLLDRATSCNPARTSPEFWSNASLTLAYLGVAISVLSEDDKHDPHGNVASSLALTRSWLSMQLSIFRTRKVIVPKFSPESYAMLRRWNATFMGRSFPEEFHAEFLVLVYGHAMAGGVLDQYLRDFPTERRESAEIVTVMNKKWTREQIKPIQDACEASKLEGIYKDKANPFHHLMILKVFTDFLDSHYHKTRWVWDYYISNFRLFDMWYMLSVERRHLAPRRPLLVNLAGRWCIIHGSKHAFYCDTIQDALLTWLALVKTLFYEMSETGLPYGKYICKLITDEDANAIAAMVQE